MPLILAERIILAWSQPGDPVLDPFAGSGTTNLAAVAYGRSAIGTERNPAYAEIACRRMAR
jgi:DNA modification methylase